MRQRFFARNGRPGSGRNRNGPSGENVCIEVPPGTTVTDLETGERLLDLLREGQEEVLLRGGRGGKGNAHFKTAHNQAPRFAQPGEDGETRTLRVEIRIIADIGFVGSPNAGKSTLLKVLTAANPKIGNYPFTTVIPNLGVMQYHDEDIVLADIPGLIKGAGSGAGLGIRFLKHLARTRGLAFVIDVGGEDPIGEYAILREELRAYSPELLDKQSLIVLTKSDRIRAENLDTELPERLQRAFGADTPVVSVSALTHDNLEALRRELSMLVESDRGSGASPE